MSRVWCALILAIAVHIPPSLAYDTFQEAYEAGIAKAKQKQLEAARTDFREAVKLAQTPKDRANAQLRIVEAYEQEKAYAKALEACEEIVKWKDVRASDKYYALWKIGAIHYAEGDYAKAEEAFVAARDVEGLTGAYKVRGYSYLTSLYERQREYAKLRQACADLLALKDVSVNYRADAQYKVAESYYAEKQFLRAIEEYRAVYGIDPDGKRYPKSRVEGRIRQSEREHEKLLLATEGHPYYESKAQFRMGYEHYLDREFAKARDEFAKVVAMEKGYPDYRAQSQLLVGYTYFVTQHYDEARAAYAKAREIPGAAEAHKSEAWYYTGRCHFRERKLSEAEAAFRAALECRDESGRVPLQGDINGFLGKIKKRSFVIESKDRKASVEEKEAQRLIVLDRMAKEGLSKENCYLKGQLIAASVAGYHWPFPEEFFPYDWSFDDGTLCGINQQGPGIADLRVEGGVLKFTVKGEDAYFSWGNYDATKPALRFGYGSGRGRLSPRMAYLAMRIKQSADQSVWQVGNKYTRKGKAKERYSGDLVIKGREWQTVVLKHDAAYPPYPAFRIITKTPGNNVEIDNIRPLTREPQTAFRKTLELPAAVRWAKCSISAPGAYKLYVNGEQALHSPPVVYDECLWNYGLKPELFRKGVNVIGYQGRAPFLLDGALLCEDGTYLRFDSDTSWKGHEGFEHAEWAQLGYVDEDWADAYLLHERYAYAGYLTSQDRYHKFWFNPSYKGQITAEPADGRSQPVFGSKEDVRLKVAVPRRRGEKHTLAWQVFNEMGDGFHAQDKLVKEGTLPLRAGGLDEVGELKLPAGELPHNIAYAVVLHLQINGKEAETRRYEIAVCGPVEQPVVDNPKSYTEGMQLKLIWEMDTTEQPRKGEFVCVDNKKNRRDTTVIETPLGRFRQLQKDGQSALYISYKYRIEHPGRPHVALAEYPDDTDRIQEMRVTEGSVLGQNTSAMTELGNHTAVLGIENPLTHKLRQHHCVFFPNNRIGAISIFSLGGQGLWKPSMAARVGKIRIYEITNDIPMHKIADAPGKTKWFGQLPERGPYQVMHSCLTSPLAPLIRKWLILSDTPNFYRNWMVTYINLVKRLRFAGENAYYMGQYMYASALFASKYSYYMNFVGKYSGSLRDSGVLMAKMFEENGLGSFTGLEMVGPAAVTPTGGEDHIAQGVPTFSQVDRHGKQHIFLRRKYPYPNWIHPEVRQHFETVINELLALYGKQNGWKGIVLQVNESLGPCWKWKGTPYDASYDDYTIALFERESGVKIPVVKTDRKRFTKRHDWLLANARQKWTDWRCRKLTEIYEWVRDRVKATRPDLNFIFYCTAGNYIYPPMDEADDTLPSVYDYARRGGIDIGRLKEDKDIILAVSVAASTRRKTNRRRARSERFFPPFVNDGVNGIAVRNGWFEPQVYAPEGWVFYYTSPESWPMPGEPYWSDFFTNTLIRTNPALILHPLQDVLMWMGREPSVARFAKAFRSLPAAKYTRLKGNGRDNNVWIGVTRYGSDIYGYIANPQWWELDVQAELADGLKVHDLIHGGPVSGASWQLTLEPYGIRTFRVAARDSTEVVSACRAEVSEKGKELTRQLLAEFEKTLQEKRQALKHTGADKLAEELLAGVRQALARNDYATAYDELTTSPVTEEIEKRSWKEEGYEPRKMIAKKRTKAIAIDGDLAEWPKQPDALINEKKQVFTHMPDKQLWWTGAKDCSATLRVRWDADSLYYAIVVQDDDYNFGLKNSDSVELYFDTDVLGDYGEKRFNEDDAQLKMAPAQREVDPVRVELSHGQKSLIKITVSSDGIQVASSRTEMEYRIEARIPWSKIHNPERRVGKELGFDVMIIDRDKGQLKQVMWWSAPRPVVWRDVRLMGRMLLGE